MALVMKDAIFKVKSHGHFTLKPLTYENNKKDPHTFWNTQLILEFETLSAVFISSVIVFELFVKLSTQTGTPERQAFIVKL